MMISPEGYFEMHLKGKTKEQLISSIRGLKNKMGQLKNTMEHPEYIQTMHPSESTQLWCTRLYLERAKQALIDAGGTYKPSQAELKAMDFEDNIPYISKIVFNIGGYCGGYEIRNIFIDNEKLLIAVQHSFTPYADDICFDTECQLTKLELYEGLKELHIGEWRQRYGLERFGYRICDGTQWELEFHYTNGHKVVSIYGDNAYPYNFKEFQELLGISDEFEDDE